MTHAQKENDPIQALQLYTQLSLSCHPAVAAGGWLHSQGLHSSMDQEKGPTRKHCSAVLQLAGSWFGDTRVFSREAHTLVPTLFSCTHQRHQLSTANNTAAATQQVRAKIPVINCQQRRNLCY
jgi:hypothetical protein